VLFGPWGDPGRHIVVMSDWTCAPCGKFDWPDLPAHSCVRDIPTERVLTIAEKLLHKQSEDGRRKTEGA
jgi:heptosyltransferase-2/heptosyltransferase-3